MTSLAQIINAAKLNFTKRPSFTSPFAKMLGDTRGKMNVDRDTFLLKLDEWEESKTVEKVKREIGDMFAAFDEWCLAHPLVENSIAKFLFDSNFHITLDYDQFTLPAANGEIENAFGEFFASLPITDELVDPEAAAESEFTVRRLKGAFILMMARLKSSKEIEQIIANHRKAAAARDRVSGEKLVEKFYNELLSQGAIWDVNYKEPSADAEKANGHTSDKKPKKTPKKAKAPPADEDAKEEEEEKPAPKKAKKTKVVVVVVAEDDKKEAEEEEKPAATKKKAKKAEKVAAVAVVEEKEVVTASNNSSKKSTKKKARDDTETKKPAAKKAKKTAPAAAKKTKKAKKEEVDEKTEDDESESSESTTEEVAAADDKDDDYTNNNNKEKDELAPPPLVDLAAASEKK